MKKITLYTTPACAYCQMLKKFFADNKIKFEEIDVAADQKRGEEMVKKSGQMGVPVTVISKGKDEEVIVGFDQGKIKKALDL